MQQAPACASTKPSCSPAGTCGRVSAGLLPALCSPAGQLICARRSCWGHARALGRNVGGNPSGGGGALTTAASALQAPKITVDPSALKQGIWGNTWKEWGEARSTRPPHLQRARTSPNPPQHTPVQTLRLRACLQDGSCWPSPFCTPS